MPGEFQLDEAAVAQTEQMLTDTGEAVEREALKASGEITTIAGGAWRGGASTAAANKQSAEFEPAVRKLRGEIDRISEALGLGRVTTFEEDSQNEQQLLAVNPDVGNFGRL